MLIQRVLSRDRVTTAMLSGVRKIPQNPQRSSPSRGSTLAPARSLEHEQVPGSQRIRETKQILSRHRIYRKINTRVSVASTWGSRRFKAVQAVKNRTKSPKERIGSPESSQGRPGHGLWRRTLPLRAANGPVSIRADRSEDRGIQGKPG